MAFEVFERNGLIFDDWYPVPQSDDCVNDMTPSCKDEWPQTKRNHLYSTNVLVEFKQEASMA